MVKELCIIGIEGLPEITPGMELASLIVEAAKGQKTPLEQDDVLVITQKVVSKAEGMLVDLDTITPSHLAQQWADEYDRDARLIEVALMESRRVSRMDRGVLITETIHGFYCVNGGVDASNIPGENMVALLPKDPDASAARIAGEVRELIGLDVAVVITDSWGRPWRDGITNIAIGSAGIAPLRDYRGSTDPYGYELQVTAMAVVDELAAAAELVMGKVDMVPAAIIRGYEYAASTSGVKELIRPPDRDIFR